MPPPKETPLDKMVKALGAIRAAREETTVVQAQCILTLFLLGGAENKDVRQEDIGDRLGFSQNTVSAMLSKFIKSGLLKKEISPVSEREKVYAFTPQAKKMLRDIQDALA